MIWGVIYEFPFTIWFHVLTHLSFWLINKFLWGQRGFFFLILHIEFNVSWINFLRFYLFIFKGKRREKGRERNINAWLPLLCPRGTWSTTQACVLTGNQTSDPFLRRPTLNPLSYTSQGYFLKVTAIISSESFLTILTVCDLKCHWFNNSPLGWARKLLWLFLPS